MSRTPGWSAVVVNHNGGGLLVSCVQSLEEAGASSVVVVDNASTDDSLQQLDRAATDAEIVGAPGNLGYAGGANYGIARTSTEIVAVMNPDTVVTAAPDGASVGALLERFAESDVGVVGPHVIDSSGETYPSARMIPSITDAVGHGILGLLWRRNPFTRRYRQLDVAPDRTRDVDWVSGAAIWIRRSALDDVGGWDDAYFMYVEDVDLCWRLRRRGWRVVYEPSTTVVHVQGVSTAQRPYRMLVQHHRSLLRFAAKRWKGVKRLLLVPAAVFLALRAAVTIVRHWWTSRGRSKRGAATE